MITIELVAGTGGIPKREDTRKDKTASDFYRLGQEAASLETRRNAIDAKQAIADMYSSLVMAQSRNILNTVLADVARVLAQVKFNNAMISEYMKMITNGMFQPPPPLTPLQLPPTGELPLAQAPNSDLAPSLPQAGGPMMPPGQPSPQGGMPAAPPNGMGIGMGI